MAETILSRLRAKGVLQRVIVAPELAELLDALQLSGAAVPRAAGEDGDVQVGISKRLAFFSLDLQLPVEARPYAIDWRGPSAAPTGFLVAVSLKEGPQARIFRLASDAVGRALKRGKVMAYGTSEWMVDAEVPGDVELHGTNLWLIVEGAQASAATMKFAPSRTGKAIVKLQVVPPTVKLGSSPFGMAFPEGVTIDLADDGSANAEPLPWKGIAVPKAKFYLPQGALTVGGPALEVDLQVGLDPPGVWLATSKTFPETPSGRPQIDVVLEMRDPAASGLSSLAPTLVEIAVKLPITKGVPAKNQMIQFTAGTPVYARARYARRPGNDPYAQEFSLSIDARGAGGIASMKGDSAPGKLVVAGATVATGVAAGAPASDAKAILGVVSAAVTSFVAGGKFTVNSATLASVGRDLPVGDLRFALDYTVETRIQLPKIGPMEIGLSEQQPLRLRMRDLTFTVKPEKSGLEKFDLDFSKSCMEIEDPGRWTVSGTNLFDVLGSRSGQGSIWYEIDLGFRLDLGPVKVSGTTVRVGVDPIKAPSLTGLSAGIDLKPLISGSGALMIESPSKFSATLSVCIQPLQVYAAAAVQRSDKRVNLELAADFPGPLPLANSGLGLFALGGAFCANGEPDIVNSSSLEEQLGWIRRPLAKRFRDRPNQNSYGLSTVIGTVPDLGFSFSSIAAVMITAPTFGIRAAMLSSFMSPRLKLSQTSPGGAVTGQGALVIDDKAVFFGLAINLQMPPVGPALMEAHVPIAAYFPRQANARQWFVHIGADGKSTKPDDGREIGPVRVELFPTLPLVSADAYLMVRGGGIVDFPRPGESKDGALVALGFGFDITIGVKPIVWAEVYARAAFLLTMDPVTFRGRGEMGGSLGIGPFSIGIDAVVDFYFANGAPPWVDAEVCGTIDLFFDELRECVRLTINDQGKFDPPDPTCPLDHGRHRLVDDAYQVLEGTTLPDNAAAASTVWPDAIPLIVFSTAPNLGIAAADTNFDINAVNAYPTGVVARPLGNDQLSYEWTLTSVKLFDDATNQPLAGTFSCAWLSGVTDDPAGQAQPAQLALLTPDNDLWLNAVQEGGKDLPHKPLQRAAELCQMPPPPARPGWAVGALAMQRGLRWRLPPDPQSADPLQSSFHVDVGSEFAGTENLDPQPLTRTTVSLLLPARYSVIDPRLVDIPAVDAGPRVFSRGLQPPMLSTPVGRMTRDLRLRLRFSEELRDVTVWCYVRQTPAMPTPFPNELYAAAYVEAEPGWTLKLLENRRVLRFSRAAAAELTLICSAGLEIVVLGVHGISASAEEAAAKAKAAWDDQVARKKQPPTPPTDKTTGGNVRCVLDPGKTYRIELQLNWVAKGAYTKASTAPEVRNYYFKTAPLKTRSGVLSPSSNFAYIHKKVPEFDPAMIERYLDAYQPGHNTQYWFRKDPLRVHFRRGHVAALAGTYGFDLECVVRTLDKVEDVAAFEQKPRYPISEIFLPEAQQAVAKEILRSPCGFNPPGLVWWARFDGLDPLSWYTVQMKALPRPPAAAAPRPPGGARIPGATFRTSRWNNVADMLKGLGFDGTVRRTDCEVIATASARVIGGNDEAFEKLLGLYGIDGWPRSTKPRISHLWIDSNGWRYVGVFIESPEPIHRPGRVDVGAAALKLQGGAMPFNVEARDRSGCRLLYATAAPFVPPAGALLQITLSDLDPDAPGNATGLMGLASAPAFAVA